MGKQVDYPADNVGYDGTVYPTVGENIRHLIPLDNLTWVDVSFHVTKDKKPVVTPIPGRYAGIFYVKSTSPKHNFVCYQDVYIGYDNDHITINPKASLYNFYEGDVVLSLLVSK